MLFRGAIPFVLAACTLVCVAEEATVRPKPTLNEVLASMPENLRYVPPRIPDEANAYPMLVKAAALLTKENYSETYSRLVHALLAGRIFPEGEDGEQLRDWFRHNRDALDLIDKALQVGVCCIPLNTQKPPVLEKGISSSFRQLVRLKQVEALDLADRGEWEKAAAAALQVVQLGRLYAQNGPPLIEFLTGSGCESIGLGTLRSLAQSDGVTAQALSTILRELETPWDAKGAEQASINREFLTLFAWPLAHVTADQPVAAKLNTVLTYSWGVPDNVDLEFDDLLVGKPQAFKIAETRQLYEKLHADLLKCLNTTWPQRPKDIGTELEAFCNRWDMSFSLLMKHVIFLHQQKAQKAKDPEDRDTAKRQLWGLGDAGTMLSGFVEDLDAEEKKTLLHSLEEPNAVGQMVVTLHVRVMIRSVLHVHQEAAYLGATRLVVALRIYEGRTGALPDDLAELVKSGILQKVPVDPFSCQPFAYSKARRLIWSVGENEKDDGGVATGDGYGDPDIVWSLAILKSAK